MIEAIKAEISVSTHSRTKAAACKCIATVGVNSAFQHTAARRRLLILDLYGKSGNGVSTHSHPKVAANLPYPNTFTSPGFNTQPPEGGCVLDETPKEMEPMFQHTATRRWLQAARVSFILKILFQHTATRRWLLLNFMPSLRNFWFQHTATRRWLRFLNVLTSNRRNVSTHSHPKVAADALEEYYCVPKFQHTATRRWLPSDP